MGLNITHTMSSFQFENRENLRNTAKNILNKQGVTSETVEKIVDQAIFSQNSNPQFNILSTATQIALNNTLQARLKILKEKENKKNKKEPIFGELWNIVSSNAENSYDGELLDFEIDSTVENIFMAA